MSTASRNVLLIIVLGLASLFLLRRVVDEVMVHSKVPRPPSWMRANEEKNMLDFGPTPHTPGRSSTLQAPPTPSCGHAAGLHHKYAHLYTAKCVDTSQASSAHCTKHAHAPLLVCALAQCMPAPPASCLRPATHHNCIHSHVHAHIIYAPCTQHMRPHSSHPVCVR